MIFFIYYNQIIISYRNFFVFYNHIPWLDMNFFIFTY